MNPNAKLYEQISKIHFAILATVLVLLVASSLTPAAELTKATDEASTVAGLNVSFTRQRVESAVSDVLVHVPTDAISVHEARNHLWWRVENVFHPLSERTYPLPRPRLWIPLDKNAYSPPHSVPSALAARPSERTLRQFKEIWTFLINGHQAFIVLRLYPSDAVFRYSEESSAEPHGLFVESISDKLADPSMLKPERDFITDVTIRQSESRASYAAILEIRGGQTDDPHVRFGRQAVIPVETRPYDVELLPAVLTGKGARSGLVTLLPSVVMGYSLSAGSRVSTSEIPGVTTANKRASVEQDNRMFDSVFRNLEFYAKGLESLKIEELQSYLERLRNEKGEEVELYGAKIPQRAISIWGVVVLATLQLYFLSHLMQLGRVSRITSLTPEYPWVGVYPDRLSKTITAISLFLAPLNTSVLLISGWGSLQAWLTKIGLIAGLIASIVVSGACWLEIGRIRAEQARNDGELRQAPPVLSPSVMNDSAKDSPLK